MVRLKGKCDQIELIFYTCRPNLLILNLNIGDCLLIMFDAYYEPCDQQCKFVKKWANVSQFKWLLAVHLKGFQVHYCNLQPNNITIKIPLCYFYCIPYMCLWHPFRWYLMFNFMIKSYLYYHLGDPTWIKKIWQPPL